MKIACVQLNVRVAAPERNYSRAETLIRKAAKRKPDVILLPEVWNTGFAPGSIDPALADTDGRRTRALCGGLAAELGVNIAAGSVLTRRGDALYNTAYIFDRAGGCIAAYDKTHLFSPMREGAACKAGNALVTFPLDGVACGVLICYDLRFPELSRALALGGARVLLIPAQWPKHRTEQMQTLLCARAIENQLYAALCNGCGSAPGVRYGGKSAVIGPRGRVLALARRGETICYAQLDLAAQDKAHGEIPVFTDRRPELYGAVGAPAAGKPVTD